NLEQALIRQRNHPNPHGLSRRRSRVRAPSLPPLLSMSYWAPVKIRDTPRFSTVTLLIGLRSRYLRLASGTPSCLRDRNRLCRRHLPPPPQRRRQKLFNLPIFADF